MRGPTVNYSFGGDPQLCNGDPGVPFHRARPGCSIEVPGGGDDALHGRRDHPAAGALSLAGAPAGQHLAGRCSGDGRLLREVLVDDRPWLRSPEGYKQGLVCQVLHHLYRAFFEGFTTF